MTNEQAKKLLKRIWFCDMWKMQRIQDDYNGLNEDDI